MASDPTRFSINFNNLPTPCFIGYNKGKGIMYRDVAREGLHAITALLRAAAPVGV